MTPPIPRDLFEGLEDGRIHLNSGSDAPLLRAMQNVMRDYAQARADGASGRQRLEAAREQARAGIARLLHVPGESDHIGFFASTGHALEVIARGLDWHQGDEVLTLAEEYPSDILAWRALQPQGVTTRLVEGGQGPEQALIDAITPSTRLVCVSHVSYRTSLRLDILRLSAALRSKDVMFVVDAGHALGVLPVDARLCDAVVACGHKFLLGLHGTGILYWNRDTAPAPTASLGWYGVEDFAVTEGTPSYAPKPGVTAYELGNPAFVQLLGLNAALRCLEQAGHNAIADHALTLAHRLRSGLVQLGYPCLTPADPARSGTSVAIPGPKGDALHAALVARGVRVAKGVGRLRLTVHGYNSEAEVAAVLEIAAAQIR